MLVLGVLAVGTVGFWLVWRGQHASWLDAFYMTAITITTIGYEEVYNLEGFGRIWAVLVAFLGVGSLFYSFGVVMEYVVTTRLMDPRGRLKMQDRIAGLKGYVVVAGLGRVGRQAALELQEAGVPFVVVDPSDQYAEEHSFLFLLGDAAKDEVLERAGLRRASGLIVTTSNDASKLYIVLSARVLS